MFWKFHLDIFCSAIAGESLFPVAAQQQATASLPGRNDDFRYWLYPVHDQRRRSNVLVRWNADQTDGIKYLSLTQGILDASQACVVNFNWDICARRSHG